MNINGREIDMDAIIRISNGNSQEFIDRIMRTTGIDRDVAESFERRFNTVQGDERR